MVIQAKSELENLYTLALQAKKAAEDAGEDTDAPMQTAVAIKWKEAFYAALDDDINTPKAFSIFFEMLKDGELPPGEKVAFLKAFDRTTMLGIKEAVAGAGEIPAEITKNSRNISESRSNKQFIQSDALSKELEEFRI